MKRIIFFTFILITFFSLYSNNYFADVNNEKDIKIAFDPNLPPYQFYEDGEYKGFNLDLINKIAQKNNLKIQLIPMPLNESYEKFKHNEVDVIMGIRYTKDIEDVMDVSDSLVQSTISMVIPRNRADEIRNNLNAAPLLIALEGNSVEYDFANNLKKANFNLTFNQGTAIDLLLIGRADMMIGVKHVVEYILDKNNLTDAYVISDTFTAPVNYYLGINKSNEKLINIVNTELKNLRINGEYEEIYNRWINDKNIERQKTFRRMLYVLFIIAVIIIIVVEIINLQLRQLVKQKTKALTISNKELENKIIEIKNTNELKNFICESSPRSIITFDLEGVVTMMNEPALKMCKLDSPLIGKSVYDITPVNFIIQDYAKRVLLSGEKFMGNEIEYKTNGMKWIYRFTMYPLSDYEMQIVGAIVTIEDVTLEKALRLQVEEKEKTKALTQIVSGIAHEIRNPLTSIKAYVELLPRKKNNEEFQRQISTVVPYEVERVNKLIEQLINYSKPREKSIEVVELEDLIESVIILLKPVLDRKNIKFNTIINENLSIKLEKDKIKQVLINLIINAMDAIDEMRSFNNGNGLYFINLSAVRINDSVVISIEDNGIGMTENENKSSFDFFYTTKEKGSGIGLTISKQIVNENGGEISIESQKYKGSKVSIVFMEEGHGQNLNN
ncbi:MAG: transporter substrate-binding domain-containing protein [Sedimentibacter sp.]